MNSADALVLMRGQKEDDFTYSKSAAMQVRHKNDLSLSFAPSHSISMNRHGYSAMKCMMFS